MKKAILTYTYSHLPIDGGKIRYPDSLEEALNNSDYEIVEIFDMPDDENIDDCVASATRINGEWPAEAEVQLSEALK